MAIQAFSAQYKNLFSTIYLKNPLDNGYYQHPDIVPSAFRKVVEQEDAWLIYYEDLSGPFIEAYVGKQSGLVQFDSISVSVE